MQYIKGASQITHSSRTVGSTERCAIQQGYIIDNTLISYSVHYIKGVSAITHSSRTVGSTERCAIHQGYITDSTLISYSMHYIKGMSAITHSAGKERSTEQWAVQQALPTITHSPHTQKQNSCSTDTVEREKMHSKRI